jgi:hypothetical protein
VPLTVPVTIPPLVVVTILPVVSLVGVVSGEGVVDGVADPIGAGLTKSGE